MAGIAEGNHIEEPCNVNTLLARTTYPFSTESEAAASSFISDRAQKAFDDSQYWLYASLVGRTGEQRARECFVQAGWEVWDSRPVIDVLLNWQDRGDPGFERMVGQRRHDLMVRPHPGAPWEFVEVKATVNSEKVPLVKSQIKKDKVVELFGFDGRSPTMPGIMRGPTRPRTEVKLVVIKLLYIP